MKRVHLSFLSAVMIVATLAISATRPAPILAQAPAPERLPSFEIASIKQNTSGDARTSMGARPGGRMVVTNQPLRDLIAAAFEMFDSRLLVHSRILGGPGWIDTERYDIEGKASGEFQFSAWRSAQGTCF